MKKDDRIEMQARMDNLLSKLGEDSPRESSFINSLSQQLSKKKRLTAKQIAAFDKIEKQVQTENEPSPLRERVQSLIDKQMQFTTFTSPITPWENSFLKNIRRQNPQVLSAGQEKCLLKIEEKLSDKNIQEAKSWKFDENKRSRWHLVMEYYKNTPYYRMYRDPRFVVTKEAYEKVITNKYAKRILAAAEDKPKFEEGSLVMIRANYNAGSLSKHMVGGKTNGYVVRSGKVAFVVANDKLGVYNACKGGRVYSVLVAGESAPSLVEERYLKKVTKKNAQKK